MLANQEKPQRKDAGTKAVDGGYRGSGNTKLLRAKTINGTGTATLTTTYVYP